MTIHYLSKGYIHRYWTGPPSFASFAKWIGKWTMTSKNAGRNTISSLHNMIGISASRTLRSSIVKHLEHRFLKNLPNAIIGSHTSLGNKPRITTEKISCNNTWWSWLLKPYIFFSCMLTHLEMFDEKASGTFKLTKKLHTFNFSCGENA